MVNSYSLVLSLIDQSLEAIYQQNYEKLENLVSQIHRVVETHSHEFSKVEIEKVQQNLNNLLTLLSSAKSIVGERLEEVQNKIRFLVKLEIGEV